MTWEPKENAWDAYIKFEKRMQDDEKCLGILERYIDVFPKAQSYLKLAKFLEKQKMWKKTREVYEKAMGELGKEALDEEFLLNFIQFEIKSKEFERVKVLFQYGLEKI